MILFGGHDGTRHLADVHLFDFVNQSWSLLVASGVPPMPRDSHVSVTYRDSMYVFGGELTALSQYTIFILCIGALISHFISSRGIK